MVAIDRPEETITADFYIKVGDTEPNITAELNQPSGSDEDLTGDTVKFQMWAPGSDTKKVDAVATIDDAQTGLVSYNWSASDTDTEGFYLAQWAVDNGGTGSIDETFPNDDHINVRVHEAGP